MVTEKFFLFTVAFVAFFLLPSVPGYMPSSRTAPLSNPNMACIQTMQSRNFKDKYPDPTNCHFYYQCFYLNDSVTFGYRRHCPIGTFWSEKFLECLPEGPVPCGDYCLHDEIKKRGCYAGSSCRQYFTCTNKVSHAKCCPDGTQFNPWTDGCKCDISNTCADSCTIRGLGNLTAQSSTPFNASVCRDQSGNTIMAIEDEPSFFKLISSGGVPTAKQQCPPSLYFDLLRCRCNVPSQGGIQQRVTQQRKALIWMPFDVDTLDHSVNQYPVIVYGEAHRDSKTSAVTGGGSLAVVNGYIQIDNLKAQEFHNKLSICVFFRCESNHMYNNSHFCLSSSGILSNNKDETNQEYSFILGVKRFNRFIARFNFLKPIGAKNLGVSLKMPSSGWNQVCITYDGSVLRFYLNSELLDVQLVGGSLFKNVNAPFLIGTDPSLGTFTGHIDDILITPFDMTHDEIKEHYSGNRAFLINKGFFLAA